MKCIVKGSGADILKFRDSLRNEVGACKIIEDIPNAAMQGSRFCTAVFQLDTSFLDFKIANRLYNSEVHLIWKDKEYYKPRMASCGKFQQVLVENDYACSAVCKELTSDEASDELSDFEDLECWELRRAGEL